MIQKTIQILNQHGLHTRPATVLVQNAAQFRAEIFITYREVRVNAKSILGLLILAVEPGAEIIVEAEGSDAEQAVDRIAQLAAVKFNTE